MLKNSFILLLTAILFSCGSQEGDISEMNTPNSPTISGGSLGQCAAITGPTSACLHYKQTYQVDCTTATSGSWSISGGTGCINTTPTPSALNHYGVPVMVDVIFESKPSSTDTVRVEFFYTSMGNNWIDSHPTKITNDCKYVYCN